MRELWLLNEAIIEKMLTGTKQTSSCNLSLENEQTTSGENQICINTEPAGSWLLKGENLQGCRQIKGVNLNYK